MKKIICICAVACLELSMLAQTVVIDSLRHSAGSYSNPLSILDGTVPGVRMIEEGVGGGNIKFEIRGLNTLRAAVSPVIVVDGAMLSMASEDIVQPFHQYADDGFSQPMITSLGLNLHDIESIEILKDASATAIYGSKGANGAIVIKTKQSSGGQMDIDLHTNAGVAIPNVISPAFRNAFLHNHSLSVGSAGKNSNFRASVFYRSFDGAARYTGNRTFGGRVSFGSGKRDILHFGGNANLYLTTTDIQTAAAWYGAPSFGLSAREILPLSYNDPSKKTSLQGWESGYDNTRKTLRLISNLFFDVKFTKTFKWTNSLGVDFRNISSELWYGRSTSFGGAHNGAAAITSAFLLDCDFKSGLLYRRYVNTDHHISASLFFEAINDWNRYNSMAGTDLVSHDLRAKGLAMMQSAAKIQRFRNDMLNLGGFMTASYDYNSFAGADVTLRYDQTLNFDKVIPAINNLYPAAKVYVDFAKAFLQGSRSVSSLRLDAGYGRTGMNAIRPYDMLPVFASGGYPVVDEAHRAYYNMNNRLMQEEYNVGLSASLAGRVDVKCELYDRKTADMLYVTGIDQSAAAGQTSIIGNRGVEMMLNAVAVKTAKCMLELSAVAAYNFNRIGTATGADRKGMGLNKYGMNATVNIPGNQVSSIYGFVLDENNVVIGEGILGNTIPKYNGGLSLRLALGSFHMDMMANWAAGFNILNLNRMLSSKEEYVSAAFVEKGDYLRLSRVCAGYDFAINAGWIKSVGVSLTAHNLLTATSYSGWNPVVNSFGFTNMSNGMDYGSMPLNRNVVLALSVKF